MNHPSSSAARVAALTCFLSLASSLSSCGPRGGTDVGNGATVTFDMRGYEDAPPEEDMTGAKPMSVELTSGDRIDELWIVVDQFKLRADGACLADDEEPSVFDAEGPFVAEVLTMGVVGALPEATVPEGAYCRFELSLHALKAEEAPASAPPDLVEHAVLMRGERADGTPFVARSKKGAKLKLNAVDELFTVRDGTPFFLGIEMSSLVSALELDSLEGPVISVDAETNANRLPPFEAALRRSVRLFEDQNRDGDLSAGESSEDSTLAQGDAD